jgi:DNA-binding transcriptional ArsR family regulator
VFTFFEAHNNSMNRDLSVTASLLGDPGRSAILLSLMGGIALPAGELADIANVAPQTASGHLARLVDGGLLSVERQGRHRYYRLSSPDVADAIEALLVLSARPRAHARAPTKRKPTTGSLAHARTCYAHLAGWLGVQITEALQQRAFILSLDAKTYCVTPSGRAWFQSLGVQVSSFDLPPGKLARRCLDWTERRHHLAGTLGCAMFKRFQELKWIVPIRNSRAIRVTLKGKSQFWNLLRVPIG